MKIIKLGGICLGVFLLLCMFRLQIILPMIYVSLGIVFYLTMVIWAKAKSMDEEMKAWHTILNSPIALVKFILTGSIIWGIIVYSLIQDLRREEEHAQFSLVEYLKRPEAWHRYWFKKYYQ